MSLLFLLFSIIYSDTTAIFGYLDFINSTIVFVLANAVIFLLLSDKSIEETFLARGDSYKTS